MRPSRRQRCAMRVFAYGFAVITLAACGTALVISPDPSVDDGSAVEAGGLDGDRDGGRVDGSVTADAQCVSDASVGLTDGCVAPPSAASTAYTRCETFETFTGASAAGGTIAKDPTAFVSPPASAIVKLPAASNAYAGIAQSFGPAKFSEPATETDFQLLEVGSRVTIMRLIIDAPPAGAQTFILDVDPAGKLELSATLPDGGNTTTAATAENVRLCIGRWYHLRLHVSHPATFNGTVRVDIELDGNEVSPVVPTSGDPVTGSTATTNAAIGLGQTTTDPAASAARFDNWLFYLR